MSMIPRHQTHLTKAHRTPRVSQRLEAQGCAALLTHKSGLRQHISNGHSPWTNHLCNMHTTHLLPQTTTMRKAQVGRKGNRCATGDRGQFCPGCLLHKRALSARLKEKGRKTCTYLRRQRIYLQLRLRPFQLVLPPRLLSTKRAMSDLLLPYRRAMSVRWGIVPTTTFLRRMLRRIL